MKKYLTLCKRVVYLSHKLKNNKTMARKTLIIEDDLIIFVMKQSNKERRSFTGQLNQILRNEKNRTENRERKEKE